MPIARSRAPHREPLPYLRHKKGFRNLLRRLLYGLEHPLDHGTRRVSPAATRAATRRLRHGH